MARPRTKYGNRKTVVDGITFDSAKESRRYSELRLMEKAGAITHLVRQPTFDFVVSGQMICRYRADFSYFQMQPNGSELPEELVVEDVKGFKTPLYRVKAKLLKAIHGIEIREL